MTKKMAMQWFVSTPKAQWISRSLQDLPACIDTLQVSDQELQTITGFGGCFNELSWIALDKVDPEVRQQVLCDLFDRDEGLGFSFCRVPIGASDYAAEWYSHNETDEDFAMDHFSIQRDYRYLIPYIKAAQAINPDIKLFASPWSPPTWMKHPRAYNNGRLRMEPAILESYALYFKKFIEAYQVEGIPITQVHLQNEPFADQKFPSCLWSAEQFKIFIRDYIGPLFAREKIDTEIWLGTLNGPTQMQFSPTGAINIDLYDQIMDELLFDPQVRQYLSGVGYQWAGQHVIQRTHESFPELRLMQTENECGDGRNTWQYAQYVFNLVKHYLVNGVESYIYWNMVLEPQGISTWGWHQNSMVSVDPESRTVTYNPEFYVMKHLSRFVRPGAKLLKTNGHWNSSSLAFANPDRSIVVLMSNALPRHRQATIQVRDQAMTVNLEPQSFNTFVF
jgi:glucosylceramidase